MRGQLSGRAGPLHGQGREFDPLIAHHFINNTMKQHPPSTKDKFEVWLGKHNRKLEFVRTAMNIIGTTLTVFVFLKVFGLV